MPTFGEWERVVLEHTFDDVDYISCHAYYEPIGGDTASFLASGVELNRYIGSVVSTADAVAARRHSDKRIQVSLDEWNVWFMSHHNEVEKITDIDTWPVAPRLLEDSYSVTDAIVVGSLLITILRNADRVRSASLAQLVNVIAPIMTEPGGPSWRQTTFYPFALTAATASGTSLAVDLTSDLIRTEKYGSVPAIDVAATVDAGRLSLFVVNRSLDDSAELTLDLSAAVSSLPAARLLSATTLSDDDITARNTLDDRERVTPKHNPSAHLGESGQFTITLPAVSWSSVVFDIAAE
jgi:alpha-N-arabinofuranosidase